MNFLKRTAGILLSAVILFGAGNVGAQAKTKSEITETKNKIVSTGANVWTYNKKTHEIKFEKLNDLCIVPPDTEDDGDSEPGVYLPWYDFQDEIKTAVFADGMKSVERTVCMGMRNLETVKIPDSVKEIGCWAFGYCQKLKNISIPKKVDYIGRYAFRGCSSLKSVKIPAGVGELEESTFAYCGDLESVEFSEGIETVWDDCFYDCKSLTEINLPESVERVGFYAFANCEGLKDINIGKNVSVIGEKAFYNTAFYNDKANWSGKALYLDNSLLTAKTSISGEYEIKDGTELIANGAFSKCKKLFGLNFPASIKFVGEGAFYKANKLKKFNVSDLTAWLSVKFDLDTDVEKELYLNGAPVEELTIPDGIKTIGYNTFSGCVNIKKLNIPSSVESIEDRAFTGCYNLKKLVLPSSIKEIGSLSFMDCQSLKSVEIPDGVKRIGCDAFHSCVKLKSVTIPKSVEEIGDDAFMFTAKSLTISGYRNTDAQRYAKEFGKRFKNLKTGKVTDYSRKNPIKVKVGRVELSAKSLKSKKQDVYPITVSNIYGIPFYKVLKGTLGIAEEAFENCSSVTGVTLPKSLKYLSDRALLGCGSLKKVTIPASVEKIGSCAVGVKEVWDYLDDHDWLVGYIADDNCAIYGEKGSAAEKYAKENGIVFNKKANPLKASVNAVIVKAASLKKGKVKVNPLKVSKAKGAVSVKYVLHDYYPEIHGKYTVNKKTGAVTFKKGSYKKGTYYITLSVTAKGTKGYAAKTKELNLKVKIK